MHDSFAGAIDSWRELLSKDNLVLEPQCLTAAATATFPTAQRIRAILSPRDRDQVQECLRIANRYREPLYPISTGNNWGYGSAVPVANNCALLDLSRLDRITEYNDSLGYVRLEPGVTQQQLHDFLQENGGKYWMDATGSSPSCSIIGNTMERGYGHSPYADHFTHACDLEVVLPNGDCIHTGFGRFANAKARSVLRGGIGPCVDGLFTQSNLGVITQMTVWLMPAPDYFQAYYFSIEKDHQLVGLIDALRPLRLRNVISNALHIANAYKVLSSIQQYPWKQTGGETPLPRAVLEDLSKRWEFGAWNGAGALYGTRGEVTEARKQIKKALNGRVRKLRFISDAYLDLAERYQTPLQRLTGLDVPSMLKLVRPVHEMMKGKPTDKFIATTYWRKKEPAPSQLDPNGDGCGLIWCSPVCPISGSDARKLTDIGSKVLLGHGFEPGMTVTLLSERCLENVIGIAYDRSIDGEDERAMTCYRELLKRLTEDGFYPYRLGTQSMNLSANGEQDSHRFLQVLKNAVDGNGILAPGRYL